MLRKSKTSYQHSFQLSVLLTFFVGDYGYGGDNDPKTWDARLIFGCVCDSSWEVGYGAGQTQVRAWAGCRTYVHARSRLVPELINVTLNAPLFVKNSPLQAPEHFGADCSLTRCPSNDDPRTFDVNEQDCQWWDKVS